MGILSKLWPADNLQPLKTAATVARLFLQEALLPMKHATAHNAH